MAQDDLRMRGELERGRAVTITVDGRPVAAYEGESLAAALFAAGQQILRTSPRRESPRGYFCGMGICHDCLMTVDGQPSVRACMTPVREGLSAETQAGLGRWGGR
jgi:NADH dehydrogenase/NADH:ubiquinone oxidoreductase subunit G